MTARHAYAAAKDAVLGPTRSLALELARSGITGQAIAVAGGEL